MTTFTYAGRDQRGVRVTGKVEANDASQAADQLIKQGLLPIEITASPVVSYSAARLSNLFDAKIKIETLILFCRQMHSLVKAGVPIVSAIQRIAEITNQTVLSRTLKKVADEIALGTSLSSAMQHYPHVFEPLMVALITAGEATGRLDEAFQQAAKYYELANTSRRRIKTALRYPIFVMIFALSAIMVMNIFVIPKFAALYSSFHAPLPMPTRLLISIAFFTRNYWWVVMLCLLGFMGTIGLLLRRPVIRQIFDHLQFKIPIFGHIIERIVMVNFSHSLAVLLQTGIPLVQALTLVSNIVNNSYAKEKILNMRGVIERGTNLSQAANAAKFFSPLVLQMLEVGEETGNLDKMLYEVSYFYEQELDYDIKQLTDKIEPILIVMVGIMVLVLALGIFLPMWNMVYIVH